MVSIIIPARNEIYLEKTIRNVLENAGGEIEILVVLDGYIPDPQIVTNDARVIFIHNQESIGQRQSINKAARIARGDFIMKLDAHCAVDKGFDVKLAKDCKYEWTVVPRMYNLDVETWKPKLHKVTDYMYIGCEDGRLLRAEYYTGEEYKRQHSKKKLIDDTMACMGPCFFMHKDRFWELEGCDENHGGWGQQGVEVSLKAWLSGGSLKVNKNTWFSHWFRGGSGPGFPYPLSGKDVDKAREYSKDLWINNKWTLQKRSFQWVIDKFSPKGWDKSEDCKLQETFYHRIHLKRNDPSWRGIKVIKLPTDFLLYHQVIWERKPDFIIDIGTAFCGSALFFADMLELTGKGQVISIDPSPRGPLIPHPRITYLKGDSKSPEIIEKIKGIVKDKSVMISIDGNHKRQQVKWELKLYGNIVTSGQYMVAEDCYGRHGELVGPGEARDWFLSWNKRFTNTHLDKRFIVGFTKGGWLLRK